MSDKITYGESIEMPGRWVRLDYETRIQPQETPYDACLRAQREAQKFINERVREQFFPNVHPSEQIIPEQSITKLSKEENVINLINSSASLNELKTYELLAKNNLSLKEAYDSQLTKLSA